MKVKAVGGNQPFKTRPDHQGSVLAAFDALGGFGTIEEIAAKAGIGYRTAVDILTYLPVHRVRGGVLLIPEDGWVMCPTCRHWTDSGWLPREAQP